MQFEFGLNWSSFRYRNADVALGRFFSVDPLAEGYYYNSVYAFSENQVTAHFELEGLEKQEAKKGLFIGTGYNAAKQTIQKSTVNTVKNVAGKRITTSRIIGGAGGVAGAAALVAMPSTAHAPGVTTPVQYGPDNPEEISSPPGATVDVKDALLSGAEAVKAIQNSLLNNDDINSPDYWANYHKQFGTSQDKAIQNPQPVGNIPDEDEGYDYFYRAMTLDEYNNTINSNAYLEVGVGGMNFITTNPMYIFSKHSFVHKGQHADDYDLIVRYKTNKGTKAYLKSIALPEEGNVPIARGAHIPIFKYEGSHYIKNGALNFGFGTQKTVDHLKKNRQTQHPQIIWTRY